MRGKVEKDMLCPCWWKGRHNDWRYLRHPQDAERSLLLLPYPLIPLSLQDSSVMMSLLVQCDTLGALEQRVSGGVVWVIAGRVGHTLL